MTGTTKRRSRKTNWKSAQRNSKSRLSIVSTLAETLLEANWDTVALATIVSLASRGLLPEPLKDTLEGKLIRVVAARLFDINSVHIDSSEFAKRLTACAKLTPVSNAMDEDRLENWLPERLRDFCHHDFALQQIADPLFIGWIYQCLLMRRSDYALLRSKKTVVGLTQITQWFTPEWVSDFLLEDGISILEAESEGTLTFLDSSCGAGHILVPALRRLTARQQKIGSSVEQAINHVLNHELFGLDIDPQMIKLSGIAIYLACRDLALEAPFAIPHLFSFAQPETLPGNVPRESDSFGSLLLSLRPRTDAVLFRIDGTVTPANDLPSRFDTQALNPPYLSHRLMPKSLSKFLQVNYANSHYDLYAAFLELSIRLMSDNGRLALICQQSFLTTSRYEELRKQLVERCHINSIVHLGAGSFDSRTGEKVNNAIISLTHRSSRDYGNAHRTSTYKMISNESKRLAEQEGVQNFQKQVVSEKSFLTISRMIPGFPLAGHCPEEIARLFETIPSIAQSDCGITLTNGLFTCDNKRFVRHFKELTATALKKKPFVPYDKGGGQKWFSTTPYLLEWVNDGDELREFRARRGQSRALPGERFYFKEGVTYSYIGTKGFKARLLSPGSVFDIASSALFADNIDLNYMLGFLNSSLVRFILGILNPTINFQIGDLRRIPMQRPTAQIEHQIKSLTTEAIELAREADRLDSASPAYRGTLLAPYLLADGNEMTEPKSHTKTVDRNEHLSAYERLTDHIHSINAREAKIQDAIDEAVFNLYGISATTRDIVKSNEWVARTADPLVQIPSLQKCISELEPV